jgi:DNA-binding transcriptional ArsR family regulator
MSWRTDRVDEAILARIGKEPLAIADLVHGRNYSTVRASIKRLYEAGYLEREWDGNQRFGRYLYSRLGWNGTELRFGVERYQVPKQEQTKTAGA